MVSREANSSPLPDQQVAVSVEHTRSGVWVNIIYNSELPGWIRALSDGLSIRVGILVGEASCAS